ncbi:geranylgeranyl pyrophosphate synthetase [Xylaria bambusicola]|uniref:geranylgeranyl pyrophosphate synthetase n=1 Tax=Xylaria bambusicola TaxID=326684 RepID=UPI002007C1B7|nr:geranylgeranyl pyrophosphate synthetase [Xylaria bambusicola]KAI0516863.1 geranylgeranyl pyrophosphate synthetase [Xylaria bambusicola]
MTEILRSGLQDLDFPATAIITDVKHLTSYNWIGAESPTIVVPGSPALWAPPGCPTQVSKDSGLVYINQNAAHHPISPLEPIFRALHTTQPAFDISSTDIVTDRNSLRKLLAFVQPGVEGDALQPFTIDIEIYKNTALFSRVEESNQETIPLGEFRGFGLEFEKAYTRQQIDGSTGHYRIVSYRFGDMSFIVRHKVDGYVGENMKSGSSGLEEGPANDLSGVLGSLSLTSNPAMTSAHGTGSRLVVRREGQNVPLDRTLEIKTRAVHRPLNIQEAAPQLWISQTPKLVRAYHKGGRFQEPKVDDLTTAIQKWQADNQVQLGRLLGLIHRLIDVVKNYGNRATVSYVVDGDKLVISPSSGQKMLPESLYLQWEAKSPQLSTIQETLTVTTQTPRANMCRPGLRIQVGEKTYDSIDVEVMPYFKTYFGSQLRSSQDSPTILNHPSIPFFDEVFRGLAKGPREFFRLVPAGLAAYKELCTTLKLLGINILEGRTIQYHIMKDFQNGKDDYDPDERRTIRGVKGTARDSAFRLLYMFLSDGMASEPRDKTMAYNAAFFVVSHLRMFGVRTRKMVRMAFDERFGLTVKQRANMDKWPLKNSMGGESSDDDQTTESGGSFYDSDDGYFYDSD